MVLKFFLLAITFLFISCADFERDNPKDEHSINYNGNRLSSSSSVVPVPGTSSVGGTTSPSSSSKPSSSSYVPTQTGIIPGPDVPYGDETYKTVVIGNQTWMAKNLNYAAPGSKCYGEGVEGVSADSIAKNCKTYGRLYDWATAMALDASCNSSSCSGQIKSNHQGICPDGWHIPSNAEWTMLMDFVDVENACTKLKTTSGWNEGNGTDDFGFAALPGGYGTSDGLFYNVRWSGTWWSSSENDADLAANSRCSNLPMYGYLKGDLRSVRCVKD